MNIARPTVELAGRVWIISRIRPIESVVDNPRVLEQLKDRGIVSKVWVRKVWGSRRYSVYKTNTGSYVS